MYSSLFGGKDRDDRQRSGGGGGRARIRFGRTGPRGKMYSSTTGSMRSSVVKGSFVRKGSDAARHIGAHLRYIQEREKGELEKDKEREFFDRDRGDIDRSEVEKEMKENQGDKTAMHKLILSPGDNQIDLKDYARESMEALEDRLGHKLNWYGVEHKNTDNHHIHVVIAGKIPGREYDISRRETQEREHEAERIYNLQRGLDDSRTIEETRLEKMMDRFDRDAAFKEAAKDRGDVYLDKWDYKELRDAGNAYLMRERSMDRALDRAFEKEFGREKEYDLDRTRDKERDRDRFVDLETAKWSDIKESIEGKDREPDRSREAAEYQARTGFAAGKEKSDEAFESFEAHRQARTEDHSREERSREDDMFER